VIWSTVAEQPNRHEAPIHWDWGVLKMIFIKTTIVVLGAGLILEFFSGKLAPELLLAVVVCFS
jgi:hypothetical protein